MTANLCPKCGAQLKAGAKFCGGCGKAIGGTAAAMPSPPATSILDNEDDSQRMKESGETKRTGLAWILGIVGIIVVSSAAYNIYADFTAQKPAPATLNTTNFNNTARSKGQVNLNPRNNEQATYGLTKSSDEKNEEWISLVERKNNFWNDSVPSWINDLNSTGNSGDMALAAGLSVLFDDFRKKSVTYTRAFRNAMARGDSTEMRRYKGEIISLYRGQINEFKSGTDIFRYRYRNEVAAHLWETFATGLQRDLDSIQESGYGN